MKILDKPLRIIIIALIAVFFFIALIYVNFSRPSLFRGQFPHNPPYPAIATINRQTINIIKIAKTPTEHSKGLSSHPAMSDDEGMLFEFSDHQVRQFWMKEMLFPLDIIWINDSRIVNISKNLPPEGLRPVKIYSSINPADTVLEINAGISDKYKFKIGDQVVIGWPL